MLSLFLCSLTTLRVIYPEGSFADLFKDKKHLGVSRAVMFLFLKLFRARVRLSPLACRRKSGRAQTTALSLTRVYC
jgi:hypothetical protein